MLAAIITGLYVGLLPALALPFLCLFAIGAAFLKKNSSYFVFLALLLLALGSLAPGVMEDMTSTDYWDLVQVQLGWAAVGLSIATRFIWKSTRSHSKSM